MYVIVMYVNLVNHFKVKLNTHSSQEVCVHLISVECVCACVCVCVCVTCML